MDDDIHLQQGRRGGIQKASWTMRALDNAVKGSCSPSHWKALVHAGKSALTYSNLDMQITDIAISGMSLSAGSILDFDGVIASTAVQGDILETKGAKLDRRSPLLLWHSPAHQVGSLVSRGLHTDEMLTGRFTIPDTTLGRDARTLILAGALRLSHGFDPGKFTMLPMGRYHIRKFTIYEVSLIPSNIEAAIECYSRHQLHDPTIRSWARDLFDNRRVIASKAFTGAQHYIDLHFQKSAK